jgi:hypothetical protein
MSTIWGTFTVPQMPPMQEATTHAFGAAGQSAALAQSLWPPVPLELVELAELAEPVEPVDVTLLVPVPPIPPVPATTLLVQLGLAAASAAAPSSHAHRPAISIADLSTFPSSALIARSSWSRACRRQRSGPRSPRRGGYVTSGACGKAGSLGGLSGPPIVISGW